MRRSASSSSASTSGSTATRSTRSGSSSSARTEEPLNEHVAFDVHTVALLFRREARDREGVRDDRAGEAAAAKLRDRERDAVERHATLRHHPREQAGGRLDLEPAVVAAPLEGADGPGPVDVALDEVAVDPVLEPHRALVVDEVARNAVAEARLPQRLAGEVERDPGALHSDDGEAGAVDRDALTEDELARDLGELHLEPLAERAPADPAPARNATRSFDDPAEHASSSPESGVPRAPPGPNL